MSFAISQRPFSRRRVLALVAALFVGGLLVSAASAHAGQPYYYLVNQNSGKVLTPFLESKNAGAAIVQMTPLNTGAQHWFVDREADTPSGGTIREFRNRWSHYCIYVKFEDSVVGRELHQDQCEKNYNANARQWIVASKSDMWAGLPFLAVNRNSNQCMDVSGAALGDYAPLIQWPCHGGPNQLFRLVYKGTSG
jgi:ricin-type beta-trefoil lectin protein